MYTILKQSIVVFWFIGFSYTLMAQVNNSKIEIGAAAGVFIYQGDLTPSSLGSFRTLQPGFNLFASKVINHSFSLRANLAFGKLYGNDARYSSPAWRQERNFVFQSRFSEITGLLVFDPLSQNLRTERSKVSPYLFTGAGVSYMDTKRDWSKFNASYFAAEPSILAGLDVDTKKAASRIIPVIPAGAGLRYRLSGNLSVNLETAYRFSFTDYMDGFSQSANPSKRDHYFSQTIGLIYSLGRRNFLKCPVIRN